MTPPEFLGLIESVPCVLVPALRGLVHRRRCSLATGPHISARRSTCGRAGSVGRSLVKRRVEVVC